VGVAEGHERKEERGHEFGDEAGEHIVRAEAETAVAIGGEPVGERETLTAAGDQVDHRRGGDGAEHLDDPIRTSAALRRPAAQASAVIAGLKCAPDIWPTAKAISSEVRLMPGRRQPGAEHYLRREILRLGIRIMHEERMVTGVAYKLPSRTPLSLDGM
jgi:hypothetical protein